MPHRVGLREEGLYGVHESSGSYFVRKQTGVKAEQQAIFRTITNICCSQLSWTRWRARDFCKDLVEQVSVPYSVHMPASVPRALLPGRGLGP